MLTGSVVVSGEVSVGSVRSSGGVEVSVSWGNRLAQLENVSKSAAQRTADNIFFMGVPSFTENTISHFAAFCNPSGLALDRAGRMMVK